MRVTETKMVSAEKAEALGFNTDKLTRENDQVEIPMWRHALVSFDHPMLMKGLCILDTPGLNALGSEPELTLSLLPSAQAVIFLLAADAGVTASDMAIWDEHISQLKNRSNLGLYAVLNKVDVLWDDLSTDSEIQANIDHVIATTAKQLDIPEANVIPVSAQKALLGRVKKDAQLFDKSRLQVLENVLSDTIMGSKEQNLWNNVINEARDVVSDSNRLLQHRKHNLLRQQEQMISIRDSSQGRIEELMAQAKVQQQKYQTQALNLKPSLRLAERQAEMLKETLAPAKIQKQIDMAANEMANAKSTVGMLKGMRQFFFQIDALMIDFCHEAERCNRLAESVFERFQEQEENETFSPRLLTAKQYRRELNTIFSDSDQFNRHLKLAFSGKSKVVSRFFNTTVYNITRFMEETRDKVDHWAEHVLHPLSQQLRDEKDTLDSYQQELIDIRQSGSDAGGRLKGLATLLEDTDTELEHCMATLNLLERFKPDDGKSNIVQFKQRKFSF